MDHRLWMYNMHYETGAAEALDGVQIAAMSDQIAKLTAALAKSAKRVVEQQSMSETGEAARLASKILRKKRRAWFSPPLLGFNF
ncbi:hypothetical protein H5410_013859 [Solanum commersonii]|uniref:Uncharacterized protein n=1 Tax=Solanum commersonii TaxID=4109 RepID=A0A9J5ZPJ8_SOLCO|nr:hypothetical protein H5410_013859 [Solanum commersonii]